MRFLKNYSLSIVLLLMFIFSWGLQFYTGFEEFKSEQQEHNEPAKLFGDDGYIWPFLAATFENWQSEFLQVSVFIILSTYLIHKNSPQSRDGDDEMMARIKRIEKLLDKSK